MLFWPVNAWPMDKVLLFYMFDSLGFAIAPRDLSTAFVNVRESLVWKIICSGFCVKKW